jgi:UDP-N-acetylmuramate--alanine ligase
LADVQAAFRELAMKVRDGGAVIAETANPNLQSVLTGLSCEVIDYKKHFDLTLPLKVPGVHNRMNAAAAKAAAAKVGISPEVAKTALSNFSGTWRRFEYKGELNGAPVYDDYGHHPTEISATMAGARELYPDKKIIAVFQPHLYSRTAELFDDFVAALAKSDRVILTHVYDARDTGKSGATGESLAEAVKKQNPDAAYFENFEDIVTELQNTVTADDVVLVMGAGDVTKIAVELTK